MALHCIDARTRLVWRGKHQRDPAVFEKASTAETIDGIWCNIKWLNIISGTVQEHNQSLLEKFMIKIVGQNIWSIFDGSGEYDNWLLKTLNRCIGQCWLLAGVYGTVYRPDKVIICFSGPLHCTIQQLLSNIWMRAMQNFQQLNYITLYFIAYAICRYFIEWKSFFCVCIAIN